MLEGIKEKATQPIGPLPAFAWVIVIVGGYFGYEFIKGRSGSSATSATVGDSQGTVSPSSSDIAYLTAQISDLASKIGVGNGPTNTTGSSGGTTGTGGETGSTGGGSGKGGSSSGGGTVISKPPIVKTVISKPPIVKTVISKPPIVKSVVSSVTAVIPNPVVKATNIAKQTAADAADNARSEAFASLPTFPSNTAVSTSTPAPLTALNTARMTAADAADEARSAALTSIPTISSQNVQAITKVAAPSTPAPTPAPRPVRKAATLNVVTASKLSSASGKKLL
jgi:hypothetical protein